jgi:hypothetical protein
MPTPLPKALDRLVSRGVLTREQADAVESEVRGGAGRGVSPAAEVAAYVGAVVTTVALGFLLADPYREAARGARVAMVGLLTALLVGAGFALRDPEGDDPGRGRLSGTLWLLAVAALGWASFELADEARSAAATLLAVGLPALALAALLYLLQRSVGQVIGLVASALVALGGLLALTGWGATGIGLAVAAFGAAAVGLGLAGRLDPAPVSAAFGGALVLVGLEVVGVDDDWRAVALVASVLAAVALFGVATRTGAGVAAVATLGMTVALPQLITHVGGSGVSTPLVLLVTGLALLGGAAVTNRLRR